jgi:hypothetical protein
MLSVCVLARELFACPLEMVLLEVSSSVDLFVSVLEVFTEICHDTFDHFHFHFGYCLGLLGGCEPIQAEFNVAVVGNIDKQVAVARVGIFVDIPCIPCKSSTEKSFRLFGVVSHCGCKRDEQGMIVPTNGVHVYHVALFVFHAVN